MDAYLIGIRSHFSGSLKEKRLLDNDPYLAGAGGGNIATAGQPPHTIHPSFWLFDWLLQLQFFSLKVT